MHRPRLPQLSELQLFERRDYPLAGRPEGEQPAVILRFTLPARSTWAGLRGSGLGNFVAGDLPGVTAPQASAPRHYSLASGWRDGFVEICMRRIPGGLCSGHLHALQPGDRIQAFVRGNTGRRPMHLYFGARNPRHDFYFATELGRWQQDHRLTSLRTALSPVAQGGGQPWAVALESPEPGRRAAHGVIELQDLTVATSGDYRRFVEVGGVRVTHTMDSRRGGPLRNEVASLTVLAPDAMSADAWATALLVAGPGEGLVLAQRAGLEALFLLRRQARWIEPGLGRFATPLRV
ncbi:MAG TPA: FAD:protein FMN transferase [Rubrivivax sp.]|nr:FAD:protein FMN transferase [Rubrivivax sp.]